MKNERNKEKDCENGEGEKMAELDFCCHFSHYCLYMQFIEKKEVHTTCVPRKVTT